ncbi:MAG: hypothetical protein ACREO1_10575 [Arenimonas sp.]
MSGFLLRGALVEYSGDFLGPIPNLVVFQFNPEELARTVNIPAPPSGSTGTTETDAGTTGAPPTESFTLTAKFSAADDLGKGGAVSAIPRVFGIGPQIAALEKMVYPAGPLSGLIGQAIDAITGSAGGDEPADRAIPRQSLPRILFIWGYTRVLPVRIKSMTITEQKFDAFLNPVQVEIQIGLDVLSLAKTSTDKIGYGALTYSRGAKDAQAILNLAKAVELAADIIPF